MVRKDTGEVECPAIRIGKTPVILSFKRVSVSSVTPASAYQHTLLLSLDHVAGTGFQAGARIYLEKGAKSIEGLNAQAVSEERLSCTVSLWGVDPGDYDVVVRNPDGSRARLSAGFKVLPLCGSGSGTAFLAFAGITGFLATAGVLDRRRHGG